MQTQSHETQWQHERRYYPRNKTSEKTLVAVTGDTQNLPYNISDISEGGLAFLYLGEIPLYLKDDQVDIYINEELQISNMAVEIVNDQQLKGYTIARRRCSVRFVELTRTQLMRLQMFIKCHSQTM